MLLGEEKSEAQGTVGNCMDKVHGYGLKPKCGAAQEQHGAMAAHGSRWQWLRAACGQPWAVLCTASVNVWGSGIQNELFFLLNETELSG